MSAHHVVAGVLVRGDAVLMTHRSPSRRWYPGVWDLPGGDVWAVRVWDGEPRNLQPEEHDELRWVTAAEARGLALAHPSYADLVDRVTGALPD